MLFKTVHGSHLYGTAHENSDKDFYVVIEPTGKRKYAKQTIVDGIDTTTVDLGTWLRHCQFGVPQALEAMFSPLAIYDGLPALRNSFRAGTEARRTYARTIKNFIYDHDTFKSRRHALRLSIELHDLLRYGRFNPVMKSSDARWTEFYALALDKDDCFGLAMLTAYG